MDRERGDEIPYGEPPNAFRRSSPGRKFRLTADEVARVRDVYRRWNAVRIERIRITKELGIRSDLFNRIGIGKLGKNPRDR